MQKTSVLIAILAASAVLRTEAAILLVPQEHGTVQAGIDAAVQGDTVVVAEGLYEETIDFTGKDITVRSVDPNDPDVVAATRIRPRQGRGRNDAGTVVTFAGGETGAAMLSGFTISGGGGTIAPQEPPVSVGGGILCVASAPTITLNVISDNAVPTAQPGEGYGGGIACIDASPLITRNTVRNNDAYAGGGVFLQGGNPRITNNLIYRNTATVGGGVFLVATGEVLNNTLAGNQGEVGSNLYAVSEAALGHYRIVNNIIANGLGGRGFGHEGSNPLDVFSHNNLWSGGDGAAAVADGAGGLANISADPLFVNESGSDYRLQMDSPCINAGDAETGAGMAADFYGKERIVHSRIDIGAVEYAGNLRPVARAVDGPFTDDVPDRLFLDGTDSHDPDGNEQLTYRWTQVWGPPVAIEDGDSSIAGFSPAGSGAYVFELVVGDGAVESRPARVEMVLGQDRVPVADAGCPVYATDDPVQLDAGASFDPDDSAPLAYAWRQVSGPSLAIEDADSSTPTISGFVRTSMPGRFRFELVVSDEGHSSLPARTEVIVLPLATGSTMRLENDSFDAKKPTVVYFGGGNCVNGGGEWNSAAWEEVANVISWSYSPDPGGGERKYERCGDILLAYLAEVAPDYREPIQTMGFSTGGQPAIDVAGYLNRTYADPRYAVNRVTFLDARCRYYAMDVAEYLAGAVDGEQCWVDTYEGTGPIFYNDILNVQVAVGDHGAPPQWYKNSLTSAQRNAFNGGLVAGAYWSVVGPGRNLQLASTPGAIAYQYRWNGAAGRMEFFEDGRATGRLPEPVTLVGPVEADASGQAMLTCEFSRNAVTYQLLFGGDPDRVMDYEVISETPGPPDAVVTELPFETTWWTVRVADAYGSTIYADPMPITNHDLSLPIRNLRTGRRYGRIQQAIDAAEDRDEIVLAEGVYHEDIRFGDKELHLRSTAPHRSGVASATVIHGAGDAVTFDGGQGTECTLSGVTITGAQRGVYCSGSHPTISNCRIVGNEGPGMELHEGSNPNVRQCVIAHNGGAGVAMVRYRVGRITKENAPHLHNCSIADNQGPGVALGRPVITGCILYFNATSIEGTEALATFSDIERGWPGEGNFDADPLFAGRAGMAYHLQSAAGRWDDAVEQWIDDAVTSPCVDAGDPLDPVGEEPAPNGGRANIGAYAGTIEASRSP